MQSNNVAQTIHDGFCFHCCAVNMKRRPLKRPLKTHYWFYCCCSMQPGKWQISESADEWRPSTWLLELVGNEPNKVAGEPQFEFPQGSQSTFRDLEQAAVLSPASVVIIFFIFIRFLGLIIFEMLVLHCVLQQRMANCLKEKLKFTVLAVLILPTELFLQWMCLGFADIDSSQTFVWSYVCVDTVNRDK